MLESHSEKIARIFEKVGIVDIGEGRFALSAVAFRSSDPCLGEVARFVGDEENAREIENYIQTGGGRNNYNKKGFIDRLEELEKTIDRIVGGRVVQTISWEGAASAGPDMHRTHGS